jgi:hypothetical protein
MGNSIVKEALPNRTKLHLGPGEEDHMLNGEIFYDVLQSEEDHTDVKFVFLFSYGNYQNTGSTWLRTRMHNLIEFARPSFGKIVFVMYDYPDYGKSRGELTEQSFYDSAMLVYRKVCCEKYPGIPKLLWGRSMGSFPTCRLAFQLRPGAEKHLGLERPIGIILESPVGSIMEIVGPLMRKKPYVGSIIEMISSQMHKVPYVFNPWFNNEKCAFESKNWGPTLFIHGENDTVSPFEQSELIRKELVGPESPYIYICKVGACGHNDVPIVRRSDIVVVTFLKWMSLITGLPLFDQR